MRRCVQQKIKGVEVAGLQPTWCQLRKHSRLGFVKQISMHSYARSLTAPVFHPEQMRMLPSDECDVEAGCKAIDEVKRKPFHHEMLVVLTLSRTQIQPHIGVNKR